MNSVERVKALCKERKIPISKLEKDLGYSNGYIRQLRKGTFPDDRLKKIVQYLSVSIDYLMTSVEKEYTETYYLNDETREIAQEIFENPDLRSLFDMSRKMPPERLKSHIDSMKNLYNQENSTDI